MKNVHLNTFYPQPLFLHAALPSLLSASHCCGAADAANVWIFRTVTQAVGIVVRKL